MDMDHQLRRLPESDINRLELEDEVIFSAFRQPTDIPDSYDGALALALALAITQPRNCVPSADTNQIIDLNQTLLEENIDDENNLDTFHDPIALRTAKSPFYEALCVKPPTHFADSNHIIDLNQTLLEENIDDENNPDTFHDPIALRAAKSPFYEALCVKPSPHFDTLVGSYMYDVDCTDLCPGESFVVSDSPDLSVQPSSCQTDSDELNHSLYNVNSAIISRIDSYLSSADSVANGFCDVGVASILQFRRGVEEASKFLPSCNGLVISFSKYSLPPETEEFSSHVVVNLEKEHSADLRRGRKHYCPDERVPAEERSSKLSAAHEDVVLSEVFDKVYLCSEDDEFPSRVSCTHQKGQSSRRSYSKKQGEYMDLEYLLTCCAENVAAADFRAAEDQFKKIRQYSSPTGYASQRLAHAFVDGLEARMGGTVTHNYVPPFRNTVVVSEMQKTHLSPSLPYVRLIYLFSNKMIYEAASRGTSLHIIDFGIRHGIQWPTLIRDLSQRPGGPPRLRITGIELPQPGFRPSQMLVETGLRLANYCERFGVPFEYNAITAQHWEAIKIDDLKLASGEVVAVNCVCRFKHLLDETEFNGDSPCPRDAVLNLIKEVNPHIFVFSVHSASHNSPYFLTRFRNALHLYSALFDTMDALFPLDDNQRLNFECEFIGREIRNIIACEGKERIERPESYKQWQSRMMRAGFKPMPLNPELVEMLRNKVRTEYHKGFMFAEDGPWLLQGWKGRIVPASACWVAAGQTHKR